MRQILIYLLVSAVCVGCQRGRDKAKPDNNEQGVPAMQLTSSAFTEGAAIPKKYSGEGEDVSPPLAWQGAPAGTKTFALICDDPDAPGQTWVHWVLFDLPADQTHLAEAIPRKKALSVGARQGQNDFDNDNIGYRGPYPPRGKPHRYFFRLYALDAKLDLAEGATREQLDQAMTGHILAQGRLMGTYKR
jgi:Raf kinase inhibitor-like YbhB/YbcL family protein